MREIIQALDFNEINFLRVKKTPETKIPVWEERVVDFNRIIEKEPFCSTEKVVTFTDLDGVFLNYGSENNHESNVSRLCTLRNIVKRSEEFVFWSSRIKIDEDNIAWKAIAPIFSGTKVCHFPFLTDKSVERLEKFARNANPDCQVSSQIGFRKMRSCFGMEDDFNEMALKTLESDKKLVVIGSSLVDRKKVRCLTSAAKEKGCKLDNFYYFDTGHLLI